MSSVDNFLVQIRFARSPCLPAVMIGRVTNLENDMSYTNKALALVAAGCMAAAVAGGPPPEPKRDRSFPSTAPQARPTSAGSSRHQGNRGLKGFDIKVFENQFNQAEQDQQVQQVLAAGQLPDVFIWWPSDATAGLGSLRALARTGVPVLKINSFQTSRTSSTFRLRWARRPPARPERRLHDARGRRPQKG